MNERSQEYWTRRQERNLIANEKTALQVSNDMKRAYTRAVHHIEREMEAFYSRYAREQGIELGVAREEIDRDRFQQFKQLQTTYLQEAEELGADPQYINYLKKMSARAYVTKMEELTQNIRHEIERLSADVNTRIGNALTTGYQDAYYTTMADINRESGFGLSFTTPSKKQLNEAVNTKWLGGNYSSRVWSNKRALVTSLDQIIPQGFASGKSAKEVANDIVLKLNTNYNSAARLARTEMNRISNQAELDVYKQAGLEQYQILATLDSITSEICREMDGKIFNVEEAQTGVTQPPFHPNCRTTTIPYFEDDDIGSYLEDRVARDEEGKSVRIGEFQTYKVWQNYPRITAVTDELYNAGLKHRNPITELLLSLTEDLNGTIDYKVTEESTSLDFSLKTENSLRRKVTSEFVVEGKSFEQIKQEMADVVRFTLLSDSNELYNDYTTLYKRLSENGLTVVKVKNTLAKVDAPYRGINTKVKTSDGYLFELQYHTPESMEVKEVNHKLYEKERLDKTPEQEKLRLRLEMETNSRNLITPKNVDKIESFDNSDL